MIVTFDGGIFDSNVHIFYDEKTKEAMIVDCGAPAANVLPFILQNELDVKYIFLTHGHYDHIHFVSQYADAFPKAQLLCHEKEKALLYDTEPDVYDYSTGPKIYDEDYTFVDEGDKIRVGEYEFCVLHTPGHTPGCICALCKSEKLLFAGDVLFRGGIGRTDLKHADPCDMRNTLARLYSLDPEITFYSGHYGSSKIGYENGTR